MPELSSEVDAERLQSLEHKVDLQQKENQVLREGIDSKLKNLGSTLKQLHEKLLKTAQNSMSEHISMYKELEILNAPQADVLHRAPLSAMVDNDKHDVAAASPPGEGNKQAEMKQALGKRTKVTLQAQQVCGSSAISEDSEGNASRTPPVPNIVRLNSSEKPAPKPLANSVQHDGPVSAQHENSVRLGGSGGASLRPLGRSMLRDSSEVSASPKALASKTLRDAFATIPAQHENGVRQQGNSMRMGGSVSSPPIPPAGNTPRDASATIQAQHENSERQQENTTRMGGSVSSPPIPPIRNMPRAASATIPAQHENSARMGGSVSSPPIPPIRNMPRDASATIPAQHENSGRQQENSMRMGGSVSSPPIPPVSNMPRAASTTIPAQHEISMRLGGSANMPLGESRKGLARLLSCPSTRPEGVAGTPQPSPAQHCRSPRASLDRKMQAHGSLQLQPNLSKHVSGLKLAVFDFDSTLSAFHVFASLAGCTTYEGNRKLEVPPPYARSERGQLLRLRALDADANWGPGGFALKAFGGPSRVAQIGHMLKELRDHNVECVILSNGMEGPIRECLRQLNLLPLFQSGSCQHWFFYGNH
jgi:hypothetical protein